MTTMKSMRGPAAATSIEPRPPAASSPATLDAESARLAEADAGIVPWRRWGPYLADRQWGTVREDYSENGDCWNSFPHDHARRRTGGELPPLLKQILQEYSATGMPPAYLPRTSHKDNGEPS